MVNRVKKEKFFWDKFAPYYDRFMQRFSREYSRLYPMLRPHIQATDQVLEVACGTGLVALEMAPYARHVTATDISEVMIHEARTKAIDTQVNNVTFAVQDAYSCGKNEQCYDTCLIINALHVVQQPETVLRGAGAALKPTGRLITATYCHGENFKSRLISFLMGMFGFEACTQFTSNSLTEMISRNGFHIVEKRVIDAFPPLVILVAEKQSRDTGLA